MKKILILCLLAASFAMAAKKNVAVFPCWGDLDDSELRKLRFRIEEIGQEVLSKSGGFTFKSHTELDKNIDKKAVFNSCSDKGGGTCLAKLTGDANADYGTWCQIEKVGNGLILYFQLFDNDEKSNLYTKMFDNLKDASDVFEKINKEIPSAFKEMTKEFAKVCKAKGKGYTWDDNSGECKSDEQTNMDDCYAAGKKWRDGKCKSQEQINCEIEGKVWIGDVCKSKEQIDCEKKEGRWENGVCKTKAQIEKEKITVDSTAIKTQQLLLQQMEQMEQMQKKMLAAQSSGQAPSIPILNILSEPSGASITFDGKPNANCPETPCVIDLEKGKHSISAHLDLGGGLNEKADTTIFITEDTKAVSIKLKPNYGTLSIRSDNANREQWSLTLNGNHVYSNSNNLLPGSYEAKLTHSCYEDISFSTSIDKGESKYFSTSDKLVPKKGHLVLKAYSPRDKNLKESVWVDGREVGKTPFSDTIPICAQIEIGKEKERVDVKMEENKSVEYTHKMAPRTQWGARLGYKRNSIEFSHDKHYQQKLPDNLISSGFGVGFFKNIQTPGIVSYNLELSLFSMSSDKISYDWTGKNSLGWTQSGHYSYQEEGLLLDLSAIIQIMPIKHIPLYFIIGLKYDFQLYDGEEIDAFRNDLGIVFGAGYYIKPNIAADFRCALISLYGRDGRYPANQYGFGVSYLF